MDDFWVTFDYLLESLWAPLGPKWSFWELKKRAEKMWRKNVQKGHAEILARGVYGPKKSTSRPQPGDPEAQEREPAASQRQEVRNQQKSKVIKLTIPRSEHNWHRDALRARGTVADL